MAPPSKTFVPGSYLIFILDAIEENCDRDPPLSIHLKIISLCLGSPCVAFNVIENAIRPSYQGYYGGVAGGRNTVKTLRIRYGLAF